MNNLEPSMTTNLARPLVALVTYSSNPSLSESDALLVAPLARHGYRAEAVAWDAPGVDWTQYAAIILRSCWDYHHRPTEFRQWIVDLERQQARLWNPTSVVLWNMDKGYLRDLARAGLATIPTHWAAAGDELALAAIMDAHGWEAAVVKPSIGASAHGAWSLSRGEARAQQDRFAGQLTQQPLLVQRHMPEIATGEWSLVFFRGGFSHAVLKRPAPGGLFVQAHHGGTRAVAQPRQALAAAARTALVTAGAISHQRPTDLLYARVDGLEVDGIFTLMEVELIEPGLMLDQAAAERFAAAIAATATNEHR